MAKNKKLIIFIPSVEDGGVEKNLYILSKYLSKKISEINLVTYKIQKKNEFDKRIKIITPSLNFLNFKSRYPKYLFCLITLLKIILFNRNILVLSFQANIFAILICLMLRIKIITSNSSSLAGLKIYLNKKFLRFF